MNKKIKGIQKYENVEIITTDKKIIPNMARKSSIHHLAPRFHQSCEIGSTKGIMVQHMVNGSPKPSITPWLRFRISSSDHIVHTTA